VQTAAEAVAEAAVKTTVTPVAVSEDSAESEQIADIASSEHNRKVLSFKVLCF
jgi:hypothetical protein